MAVSKMHPASAILAAEALGVRLFGENRVQEFQEKSAQLALAHGKLPGLPGAGQAGAEFHHWPLAVG